MGENIYKQSNQQEINLKELMQLKKKKKKEKEKKLHSKNGQKI